MNGNREYIRQSGAALMRQSLTEVPKQPTQKDKLDERTLLQRSAISAIIPDPEFFQSSTQDGKLVYYNIFYLMKYIR